MTPTAGRWAARVALCFRQPSPSWRCKLHNRTGGLSGPVLKPIALRIVWELSQAVSIPIIGIGGISTATDAASPREIW